MFPLDGKNFCYEYLLSIIYFHSDLIYSCQQLISIVFKESMSAAQYAKILVTE